MTVFVICKFDEDLIKKMKSLFSGQHFPHYKSMGAIGKTLKGSYSKVNSPIWPEFKLEILCLSRLSASLINIRLKLKRLCSSMAFFGHSRASNSKENLKS